MNVSLNSFIILYFVYSHFTCFYYKIIFTDNTTFINKVLFENEGDPGSLNIDRLYYD